ncbi:MAG: hypothetical protein E7137_02845 [Rikenellaceae bacterium]|nr:hypothetical protein [Rikenellaceae bacterium]
MPANLGLNFQNSKFFPPRLLPRRQKMQTPLGPQSFGGVSRVDITLTNQLHGQRGAKGLPKPSESEKIKKNASQKEFHNQAEKAFDRQAVQTYFTHQKGVRVDNKPLFRF